MERRGEADPSAPQSAPQSAAEAGWRRLHHRMIVVDAAQTLLSLAPTGLAVGVFGVEPSWGSLWPVIAVAVFGTVGAGKNALRWIFTRYRITDGYVERRTGVLYRRYRSVRRERIRSVDVTGTLRHRLAGLRVITVGAGQQSNAGESALVLDAILEADAQRLRTNLLVSRTMRADRPAGRPEGHARVFARLRPSWVVYNIFNSWAYVMAVGVLWGGFWLLTTFGVDVRGALDGLADWEALGWGWTVAIGALVTGAVGVIGLAVNFFTEYWNFELARVSGEQGTQLRTRQGLFTTREVNREDRRLRGLQIGEPLLWRWMGMADTNVVTTGLSLWSMSQPTTILPRGPIGVARSVAAEVLGEHPSPLEVRLVRHPGAALRRRLWWATAGSAAVVGVLTWLAATDALPGWPRWIGLAVWPVALLGAVVAYRALGHAIVGPYVVLRSGLMSRSTVALQRKSVSTIVLRQSLLQRRLGLRTVSAMTAAGWGGYGAYDVADEEAVEFAAEVAPGLLEPFLEGGRGEVVRPAL